MRFNKRGTELSMNVIVIAAIAVLVLVILAMFVFRGAGNVTSATTCSGLGGECLNRCTADLPILSVGHSDDCGTGRRCCLPIGNSNER